jgi:hypothetical protein
MVATLGGPNRFAPSISTTAHFATTGEEKGCGYAVMVAVVAEEAALVRGRPHIDEMGEQRAKILWADWHTRCGDRDR